MNNPHTPPRGFTLIELLVVMVVIGILAAIAVPAIMGARNAARRAAIASDVNQLDMKMQEYKNRFGAYPPDFLSLEGVRVPPDLPPDLRRHLSAAFPRYTGNFGTDIRDIYDAATAGGGPNPWKRASTQLFEPSMLDPAEAIVFWLGGLSLPEGADSSKLRGFSSNVGNPFEGAQQKQRMSGLHEFDPLRLVDRDGDGWYEYVPPTAAGSDSAPPYVYFQYRSYTVAPESDVPDSVERERYYPKAPRAPSNFTEWGRCTPYRADPAMGPNGQGQGWVNPQSFQILSAGLDGVYGSAEPVPKYYPSGETYPMSAQFGYDRGDLDNLTNFSTSTLEDSKP